MKSQRKTERETEERAQASSHCKIERYEILLCCTKNGKFLEISPAENIDYNRNNIAEY